MALSLEAEGTSLAPDASAIKFEAAESHIHQDQGTDVLERSPSRSQPPSSTSQINVGEMEQNLTALQKVSDDSTTPVCANKDDAKTRCKTKGKRKATDGTIGKEPGKGHSRKRAKSNYVDGVLFKLHRSRLVSKSLFFAQLLENHDKDNFPNDDVRVEIDDKGTVYHLGNTTTADDFAALLKFDDNPTEYYFQPPSFLTLAPIICAATALRFETYRTWAARVLEQTWSSSLEDLTPEPKEDAAGVIILARSCGLNGVVKRALYELARTRRISLYDYNDVPGQSVLPQIGRADERCVGLMKELLVTTWSEVAVRIDTFPCRDQPFSNKIRRVSLVERDWDSPDKCPPQTTQQVTWNERVHDSGLYTKYLFDPVCGAQELINIPWKEESWCADCIRSRRAAWRKMQQDLWTEMDKLIPDIE
ncbi:uncharacterized protein HD556DRAFT_1522406 [Suillus plorans]|uniref:BTB domain-containing protein n=1 Tax=Suillus plorans TaxID=116603 RepID=A0A9P7E3K1_9AGAM|nr:uncharacterized protein HD556DRAFT_1522406 [Suillus plorans]KAG1809987.1 hypothetical protein HD556DRAFT_1522406 [Suillus plorans]